jgi:hypothetical protein
VPWECFLHRNQLQPLGMAERNGTIRATFVRGLRPNAGVSGAGRNDVAPHLTRSGAYGS